ncbi:hypothetical protein B6U66_00290 [Candidatus Bathyarchaeota archaeon ex4484_135]|nr:MAG: hypothetical protein B6U66_00290 [Candidatus Bathyarchaeota archaeon ex4484_135]
MSVRPSVLFASVASRLHLDRARETSFRAFTTMEGLGVKVIGSPGPILTVEELSKALSEEADLKIVFVASGGTSRILREALKGHEAWLWAHPHDNSLPSALSAREKLRSSGSWKCELVFSSPDEVPRKIMAEVRVLNALCKLKEAEVVAFCSEKKAGKIDTVLSSLLGPWKPEIRRFDVADLLKALEKARPLSVSEAISILKGLDSESPTPELSLGFARGVQMALLIEEQFLSGREKSIVTFDCFDVIEDLGITPCVAISLLLEHGITAVCEADPASMVLMALCHYLSGEPPWMANLASYDPASNTLTLAHCTACPSLSSAWPYRGHFMEHFESGKPAALDIWLRRGPVVLASLQPGRKKLVLARGKVLDSGMGEEGMCRTQALVELKGNIRAFIEETGNHHVLTYSDIYEELARAGRRLGLEVVAY